jgi:hypothetical protein
MDRLHAFGALKRDAYATNAGGSVAHGAVAFSIREMA